MSIALLTGSKNIIRIIIGICVQSLPYSDPLGSALYSSRLAFVIRSPYIIPCLVFI